MLDNVIPDLINPLIKVNGSELNAILQQLAEMPCNTCRISPPVRIPEGLRNTDSKNEPDLLLTTNGMKELMDNLSGRGFSVIGQGDDALTFANGNDVWVLRIAQYPEPQDRYVAVSVTNNNPHLPVVWYHRSEGDVCVSIMERLDESDGADDRFWTSVNLAASIAHAINDGRMADEEDVVGLEPSLLEVVRILGKTARDNDYALDLTRSNIMRRPSDGHPVFIDPWCPWG